MVKQYIEELSGELLTEEWKDSIEIYSVDVTFNNEEDYGATISFGECIYEDHIVEIDLYNRVLGEMDALKINKCLFGLFRKS